MDDRHDLLHPPPAPRSGRLLGAVLLGVGLAGAGLWWQVSGGREAAPATRPIPGGGEPIVLFNGRDLTGWTVHGTERWFVEDGELVSESGPDAAYGYLRTDETFTDFDLTAEFRQDADGNSGLFFRSTIDGTRITGWQAEVAPPGLHTGGIYESYGRGWLAQPDPTSEPLLMGQWNRLRVRVEGDRVSTWLNDVPRVELRDAAIGDATGHIALQIHDGGGIRVRWRNLVLTPLTSGR